VTRGTTRRRRVGRHDAHWARGRGPPNYRPLPLRVGPPNACAGALCLGAPDVVELGRVSGTFDEASHGEGQEAGNDRCDAPSGASQAHCAGIAETHGGVPQTERAVRCRCPKKQGSKCTCLTFHGPNTRIYSGLWSKSLPIPSAAAPRSVDWRVITCPESETGCETASTSLSLVHTGRDGTLVHFRLSSRKRRS
jgi:hypothetical protein